MWQPIRQLEARFGAALDTMGEEINCLLGFDGGSWRRGMLVHGNPVRVLVYDDYGNLSGLSDRERIHLTHFLEVPPVPQCKDGAA